MAQTSRGTTTYSNKVSAQRTFLQQSGLFQDLLSFLDPEIGRAGPVYPGTITPGPSDIQADVFGRVGGALESPTAGQETEALQRLLSGEAAYTVDPAAQQEFFEMGIRRPAMRDFEQNILRNLDERFAARGLATSGVRARATGEAITDFESRLMGVRKELAYKDELARRESAEAGMQRMIPGLEAANMLQTGRMGALTSGANLGTLQRQITGQQNLEELNRFLSEQPIFNPALPFLSSMLLNAPTYHMPAREGHGGGSKAGLGGMIGMGVGGLGGFLLSGGNPMGALTGAQMGGQLGTTVGGYF